MKLEFNMGYHFEAFFYQLARSDFYIENRQTALGSSSKITKFYSEDPKFSQFLIDIHSVSWKAELRKL